MSPDAIRPGHNHPNRILPSSEVYVTADPLLVEYAPGVVDAANEGIQDVAAIMGTPLNVSRFNSSWGEGDYGSVDWFIDRAIISDPSGRHQGQVLWEVVHEGLANDPHRATSPHSGYMLIARDMTALGYDNRPINFIFGATDSSINQSVQSIYRFMEAGLSDEDMKTVTRHIARHEFGHLIGLDERTVRNKDQRGGIYEGHCMNDCTMKQVVSVSEAVNLAKSLQHRPHAGFCADCTSYARTV